MIKSEKLLVIDKTDIRRQPQNKEKAVSDWIQTDLRQKSHELYKMSDMVVGINEKGETIILKSRWGNNGIVVSHEDYKLLQELKNKPTTKKPIKEMFKGLWPFI